MRVPLEKDVVSGFHSLIRATYPQAFFQKIHQDGVSGNGFPDLIVVIEGVTLFLEAKRRGGKPSEKQKVRLSELTRAGATVGLLVGGVDKLQFELISWANPDVTIQLDLRVHSPQVIRGRIQEFVDVCRRDPLDGVGS